MNRTKPIATSYRSHFSIKAPAYSLGLPVHSQDGLFLLTVALGIQVQTQTLGIQVELVLATGFLEDLSNVPCVLDLSELNVTLALLDRISDQLRRASLTLCADDSSLLLLAGLVDNESSSLGLLLGDLLGFNSSRKLGGEGKVLEKEDILADDLNGTKGCPAS